MSNDIIVIAAGDGDEKELSNDPNMGEPSNSGQNGGRTIDRENELPETLLNSVAESVAEQLVGPASAPMGAAPLNDESEKIEPEKEPHHRGASETLLADRKDDLVALNGNGECLAEDKTPPLVLDGTNGDLGFSLTLDTLPPNAYGQRDAIFEGMISPADIKTDARFMNFVPEARDHTALLHDIEKNGILKPLLLDINRLLIDGYKRLQIALRRRFKHVPVLILPLDATDPLNEEVAISARINTQLSTIQRCELALRLLPYEQERAQKRRQEGYKSRRKENGGEGGSPAPSGPEIEGETVVPAEPEIVCGKAEEVIARQFHVGRETLRKVREIKECGHQDIIDRLHTREKPSINAIYKELQRRNIKEKIAAEPKQTPGLYTDFSAIPSGKFRCLYCDCPWDYVGNKAPFPTMSLDELKKLDVKRLAHPDGAFLWFWTTWPMIVDKSAHELLDAWGFAWTGTLVWRKHHGGWGKHLTVMTEVCILAEIGHPEALDHADGFLQANNPVHSAKPREMYPLIERLCPGPFLELFGRLIPADDRWSGFGNEIRREPPESNGRGA